MQLRRDARLLILGGICKQLLVKVIRKWQLRAIEAMRGVCKSKLYIDLLDRLMVAAHDEDGCAALSDAHAAKKLFANISKAGALRRLEKGVE